MCGCYRGKRQAFLFAMFLLLVCGSAQATLKFSNASLLSAGSDNSRFKVSNASRIIQQPSNISGISIINGNWGLKGDLVLKDSMQFQSDFCRISGNGYEIILDTDWVIPANTALHITGSATIDGNKHKIIVGDNAQIFVDTNSTLTLRNLILNNGSHGLSYPPIKLASFGSKLALDNVTLAPTGDFLFPQGQLFIYNDVRFTGSSAFIYSSPKASYITPASSMIFDTNTTFSLTPATFTDCPFSRSRTYTSNNFIVMSDRTSGLYFNGCTLNSTLTGCRVTKGFVNFDNRTKVKTNTSLNLNAAFETSIGTFSTGAATNPGSLSFSPDGRYLAIVSLTGNKLQICSFNGSTSPAIIYDSGTLTRTGPVFVSWSPDGRFVAVVTNTNPGYLTVFKFNGASTTSVAEIAAGNTPSSVSWAPDGSVLAVTSTSLLTAFTFNGLSTLAQIGSGAAVGGVPTSSSWSADGRFIATTYPATLQVFTFNGTTDPTSVGTATTGTTPRSAVWSPDGRFIALANSGGGTAQVFRFTGTGKPISVGTSGAFSDNPNSVAWSPDGKFIVAAVQGGQLLYLLSFNGSSAPTTVGSLNVTNSPSQVVWSKDGKFIATANSAENLLAVFRMNFFTDTARQTRTGTIILGNSALGTNYDVNMRLLSAANVELDGYFNYDNSLSTTLFDNDNSRFVLTSNSTIRLAPTSVLGWMDRSAIQKRINAGLGDYNLKRYDTDADGDLDSDDLPTELVYNNSNSIVAMNRTVRTNSNAFAYGIKNNSNALLYGNRTNSNAIIKLDRTVRTNSNAFAYGIKNNSNAIIKLSVGSSVLPVQNSNAIKYLSDHFITVNNGKVTVLGGITGTTNVAGRGLLSSPIDLQGGTLTLNSDMILSNLTTVVSSGNFDLQGNAMIFGGDLSLPGNVAIKIVSSGVLDGQGNELRNMLGSKLIVDNNVTLTLRNINWSAFGSTQIEMRDASSKLTLQNTALAFDRDYSFTQGQLFIQDDVFVTGTNKFSYVSTTTSYVMSHSTLYFDKNTTFSYSPRVTSRHTRSERNLIKLLDNTSEIYFNECTLQLPDSGWQLTNGTIYFDNKVIVNGAATQADSFEWGNGIAASDLNVKVLAGAWLDNYAYIYHNSGN